MTKKLRKIFNKDIFICDFEDLEKELKEKNLKLNPLEKTMAIELLSHNYYFFCQFKINLPEGWRVDKRKYFVADFFIPEIDLIIETDGKIHLSEENQIKDIKRNNCLTMMGFRIFHFNWDEVVTKNNKNWDIFNLIDGLGYYLNREI